MSNKTCNERKSAKGKHWSVLNNGAKRFTPPIANKAGFSSLGRVTNSQLYVIKIYCMYVLIKKSDLT